MSNQNKVALLLVIIIVAVAGIWYVQSSAVQTPIGDKYGNNTGGEHTSEKITYVNASSNLIVPALPFPGAVVGKSFSVIGMARGTWFFEASFPVEVIDKNGKTLAKGFAQAEGEWMTENFVLYKGDIKVPDTYIGPATLVLRKDNASGLPEHDASISFPITIEY